MRAARLHGAGDIRVADEPPPVAGPGESLVRVSTVGLCGSDLHWFGEGGIGDATVTRPLVLGHEFAGVVVAGPLRGQRVAVDPAQPCEACESCREGNPNLCPTIAFAGHGAVDGGLRELLAWPDGRLHPLPDEISDAGGAVLEPLGVAIHTVDLGHLRVGATVAVVGCGPIGVLITQVARASGCGLIVAVEPRPHRRAAAIAMGADTAMTPDEARLGGLEDATDGRGVDVAFEAAGSNEAIELAMRAARPGARVVLAGIPDDDRYVLPAALARRKGLTIAVVRRMKDVYPRAIGLVRRGRVDVESLVTRRFPLEQAAAAFTEAASRVQLKTVIDVSG